jgi:hypothetical protein
MSKLGAEIFKALIDFSQPSYMPYYWIKKCPPESVDEIGRLCRRLKMRKYECVPPAKSWSGDRNGCLVRYDPADKMPLMVQSMPGEDYRVPEIAELMRELISITGAEQVYEGGEKLSRVDMSVFD